MTRNWLRKPAARSAALPLTVMFLAFLFQVPPSAKDQVIATVMSLVFVNATVQELETGAPVVDLSYHDFLVFDNGHPATTVLFEGGTSHEPRPITIWFLLSCPEHEGIKRGS